MKTLRFLVPLFVLLALSACNKDLYDDESQSANQENDLKCGVINNRNVVKIAVLSDLHFMDPSLLKSNGTAFQMYLMQDPKLLAESGAILKEIILKLLMERPDLVLISGDLTKDGELISHKNLIKQLRLLQMSHIKVLVIPGNHDINNPDAKLFDGDITTPVPSISAGKFKSLYADFGYNSALTVDPNSLSYVAEPIKGIRILAIDANEYYNSTPIFNIIAGTIKSETMSWIKNQLKDAGIKGKQVFGMMHHGLVEHFMGESALFPDYLLSNWSSDADTLIKAGLKIIFTGHFHANDMVYRSFGTSSLFDIETGSPVIYHSPYRIVKISNNNLTINTKHIEHIIYPPLKGKSFHDYEKTFSLKGFEIQAKYMLMNPPYNVPADLANNIAPIFAEAMLAHFGGDEFITTEMSAKIQWVYDISSDLGDILMGLFTDLPPADNDLVIPLN